MGRKDICRYYSETYWDFKWVFLAHLTSCMHYGYHDESTTSHSEAVENMIRIVADEADITAADRVFVAGCGLGGGVIWLAENATTDIVGVDVSPAQLQRAKKNVRDANVDDAVTLRREDFTDTSAKDDSFDVVWALETACYADPTRSFVAEASRILRPGGRLVVADGMLTSRQLSDGDRDLVRRWLDGWQVPDLSTSTEYENYLRSEGFHRINYEDVTEHVLKTARYLYLTSYITAPFAYLMRACGLRTEKQEENRLAARYQYQAVKRGLAMYAILTAELR